jgi:hypothetical protein
MGSPKAQHEFVCELVTKYPRLIHPIAWAAGSRFPVHDRLEAAPTAHPLKSGRTVHTDATVRLVRGGRPVRFAQVEVQREYSWEKLTTMRAYHGSEVRKSGCGGEVFVLSSRPEVSERFAASEARAREDLAFRAAFVPAARLAPLADPDQPLPERALATALADFEKAIPPGALALITELRTDDEFLADLLFTAIMEGCSNDQKVEEAMTPEVLTRLEGLPSFRAWQEKARTAGLDEGREAGRQEGRQEGLREGVTEGELKGRAQSLLEFFAVRGDTVPAHAVREILGCADIAVLDEWLKRAFHGETAEQIFGPEPR